MRKLFACLAAVAAATTIFVSGAAYAAIPALTVRAVNQTQTTVDVNRNGQLDGGDYLLVSGQLTTLSGDPIGWFQARVVPVGNEQGAVTGWFVLPRLGALVVTGTIRFAEGPPQGLRVTSAAGALRSLAGASLSISDESDGSTVFSFHF